MSTNHTVVKSGPGHTISVLMSHNLNSFARIIGIFTGKGFEIDSISLGSEADPGLARITLTTHGDEKVIEQICKHLHNVIDVLKVHDLTHTHNIARELALIKVSCNPSTRSDIMLVAQAFRSKVVDISSEKLSLEITGNSDKIDAFIDILRPYGVSEVARTGSVALKREFKKK
ncbi:MAG: acetolactate synthase small subunit [Balneolaceae bacterium]